MAQVRLLQPYDNKPAGEVISVTGGVASVLVLRKVGEMMKAPLCIDLREPQSDVDSDTSRIVEKTETTVLAIGEISRTETVTTRTVDGIGPSIDAIIKTGQEAASGFRYALEALENHRAMLESQNEAQHARREAEVTALKSELAALKQSAPPPQAEGNATAKPETAASKRAKKSAKDAAESGEQSGDSSVPATVDPSANVQTDVQGAEASKGNPSHSTEETAVVPPEEPKLDSADGTTNVQVGTNESTDAGSNQSEQTLRTEQDA